MAAAPRRGCHVCYKEGNLLLCAKCRIVRYCSAECQREDWPAHKGICCSLTSPDVKAVARLFTRTLRRYNDQIITSLAALRSLVPEAISADTCPYILNINRAGLQFVLDEEVRVPSAHQDPERVQVHARWSDENFNPVRVNDNPLAVTMNVKRQGIEEVGLAIRPERVDRPVPVWIERLNRQLRTIFQTGFPR